jgi:hypothetical protein
MLITLADIDNSRHWRLLPLAISRFSLFRSFLTPSSHRDYAIDAFAVDEP